MIDLVLNADRQHAVGIEVQLLSLKVECLNMDLSLASGLSRQARKRQTALMAGRPPMAIDDHWVHEVHQRHLAALLFYLDSDEADVSRDLGSSEADAVREVHRLGHRVAERDEITVYIGDLDAPLLKDSVWVDDER